MKMMNWQHVLLLTCRHVMAVLCHICYARFRAKPKKEKTCDSLFNYTTSSTRFLTSYTCWPHRESVNWLTISWKVLSWSNITYHTYHWCKPWDCCDTIVTFCFVSSSPLVGLKTPKRAVLLYGLSMLVCYRNQSIQKQNIRAFALSRLWSFAFQHGSRIHSRETDSLFALFVVT